MLGKLIKHDFISGARRMGTIYLIAAIAAIAMIITSFFQSGTILKYLTLSVVVLVAFAAVVVTFVSIVFGANKSLFGRQGYLSQTLPVRSSSLIFSKWFVSSVWVMISYLLVILAAFGVLSYAAENGSGDDAYGIFEMVKNAFEMLGLTSKAFYYKLTFECIKGLINTLIFVMCILFSMTIGNMRHFDRFGMLGIVFYVVAFVRISQGIAAGLQHLCDISLVIPFEGDMHFMINPDILELDKQYTQGYYTCQFTGLYFRILLSVPMFLLTVLLNEKKINLK